MSSYPAVGSALHQWVFFVNDHITALCPNPTTLLRPWGGLHWPGEDREKKRKKKSFHGAIRTRHNDRMAISNTLYQWIWPEVNNLLTQSSRNQSHDRSTCHSLCGKNLLVCSTCLCMNRYLWKKWAPQWHTVSHFQAFLSSSTYKNAHFYRRLHQNFAEVINVCPSSRIHKDLLQEVRHING